MKFLVCATPRGRRGSMLSYLGKMRRLLKFGRRFKPTKSPMRIIWHWSWCSYNIFPGMTNGGICISTRIWNKSSVDVAVDRFGCSTRRFVFYYPAVSWQRLRIDVVSQLYWADVKFMKFQTKLGGHWTCSAYLESIKNVHGCAACDSTYRTASRNFVKFLQVDDCRWLSLCCIMISYAGITTAIALPLDITVPSVITCVGYAADRSGKKPAVLAQYRKQHPFR